MPQNRIQIALFERFRKTKRKEDFWGAEKWLNQTDPSLQKRLLEKALLVSNGLHERKELKDFQRAQVFFKPD